MFSLSTNSLLIFIETYSFSTSSSVPGIFSPSCFASAFLIIIFSSLNGLIVTVNVIDCDIASVDSNLDYTGIVLCQDYTSKTVEDAEANNLFAPEKVKFNFVNVTVGGKKVVAGNPEEQFGSKTAEQILYVYRNADASLVGYDATKFPAVTIA